MLALLSWVTVVLTLHASNCLTLEGNWLLLSLPNAKGLSLETSITEQIFRGQEIINKIEFRSCDSLAYQVNVVEDNIYINIETERQQSVRQCAQDETNQLNLVKRWIRGVLKFIIVDDRLTIMNPGFDPVFQFQRTKNATRDQWERSIAGSWATRMFDDPSTTYIAIADGSQLSICSGAIFRYQITALYRISLTLQSPGACSSQQLLKNIESISFYQKLDDRLYLYDGSITIVATALFSTRQATIIPSNSQSPVQEVTPITATPNPSVGLTAGRYFLLLLYKRSYGRQSVQVTSSTLTLNICSSLTFSYKLQPNSTIEMKTDSFAVEECAQGDEKYYFNTLSSIVRYTIDSDGIITLIDGNGKSVVSLSRR